MTPLDNVASRAPDVARDEAHEVEPSQARTLQGPLRSSWYVVCSAKALRPPGPMQVRLLGETIEIAHNGAEIAARSVLDGRPVAAREAHGLIWLCCGDVGAAPPIPTLAPGVVKIAESSVQVRCDFDQAVLGLVDPAHVPMVHQSWWWRPPSKARREKTKAYEPSPFGFTARAVDDFASAPIYDVVGRKSVEIEFRLPSIRNEAILGRQLRVNNLTTITPVDEGDVIIRNFIYADQKWLRILAAPLSILGARFLRQDAMILERLEKARRASGPLGLFAGDPDKPSLWYYQLKAAHSAFERTGGRFLNPARSAILKWNTCWLLCLAAPF